MRGTGSREEVIPPRAGGESGYYSAGKSPRQIEDDITRTRAQLGEILDELERKLAPRHLLERGVDMLKDSMSGDASGIGGTLRNPVPMALIGMGVGWMVIAAATGRGRLGEFSGDERERGRMPGTAESAVDKAGAFAAQLRQKVASAGASLDEAGATGPYPTESAGYAYARQKSGEAVRKVRGAAGGGRWRARETLRRAQAAGSAAWQRSSGYAGQAGERVSRAGDRFGELVMERPLLAGVLGFLAGSLFALVLPRSDLEERFVGPTGERLRARAADIGREAAGQAQQMAERTLDAATGAVKEAAAAEDRDLARE